MSLIRERMRRAPLLLEALAWLTGAWLMLDVFPGSLRRRFIAEPVSADVKQTAPASGWDSRVWLVGWAVRRASDAVPFRSVCFHRGIAAQSMLQRRGILSTLHYGIAKTEASQALQSHVWVSSNGHDVVGGQERPLYREIAHLKRKRGARPGSTVVPEHG